MVEPESHGDGRGRWTLLIRPAEAGKIPITATVRSDPPIGATKAGPTWSTWREALSVVCYRPHLRRTTLAAVVVGTVIFLINQLDVVLQHRATAITYLKSAITYLVPFCVANYGVLMATRDRGGERE